jgi:hypothetical protein
MEFDFINNSSYLSYLGTLDTYTIDGNQTEHGVYYMI